MAKIENPVTAPFQHFGLMVETFDKTTRLPVEEIIRDLLKPVVERHQEAVKTMQPALPYVFLPLPQGLPAFFFGLTFIKDRRQVFTQLVSRHTISRATGFAIARETEWAKNKSHRYDGE